jgi:hypothetical protein
MLLEVKGGGNLGFLRAQIREARPPLACASISNTIHLPFLMEYFVVDFVIPSTTQRSTTVLYNWKLPVAICLPHPSYQGGHGKQTEARPLKF